MSDNYEGIPIRVIPGIEGLRLGYTVCPNPTPEPLTMAKRQAAIEAVRRPSEEAARLVVLQLIGPNLDDMSESAQEGFVMALLGRGEIVVGSKSTEAAMRDLAPCAKVRHSTMLSERELIILPPISMINAPFPQRIDL